MGVPRHSEETAIKKEDEELAALGGKTRLISRKSPTFSHPSSPHSSSQNSTSPIEQTAPLYMSPETPPSAVETASPSLPEAQWNGGGYIPQGDVYAYSYPSHDMGEWQQQPQSQPQHHVQHAHPHMSMHSPMDIGAVPYDNGYDHAPPMAGHPQYMQPQSPVPPQVHHMHASDPHASWNYLFAQFNQV